MVVEILMAAAMGLGLTGLVVAILQYWQRRSGRSSAQSSISGPVHFWKPDARFGVEVLGNERYRPAIEALGRDAGGNRSNITCVAALVPTGIAMHPFGKVAVLVFGRQVGVLSPGDARGFRERLASHGMGCQVTICSANVSFAGGTDIQPFHYQVRLAIEPFER